MPFCLNPGCSRRPRRVWPRRSVLERMRSQSSRTPSPRHVPSPALQHSLPTQRRLRVCAQNVCLRPPLPPVPVFTAVPTTVRAPKPSTRIVRPLERGDGNHSRRPGTTLTVNASHPAPHSLVFVFRFGGPAHAANALGNGSSDRARDHVHVFAHAFGHTFNFGASSLINYFAYVLVIGRLHRDHDHAPSLVFDLVCTSPCDFVLRR